MTSSSAGPIRATSCRLHVPAEAAEVMDDPAPPGPSRLSPPGSPRAGFARWPGELDSATSFVDFVEFVYVNLLGLACPDLFRVCHICRMGGSRCGDMGSSDLQD